VGYIVRSLQGLESFSSGSPHAEPARQEIPSHVIMI
jgi:hypothetical protein